MGVELDRVYITYEGTSSALRHMCRTSVEVKGQTSVTWVPKVRPLNPIFSLLDKNDPMFRDTEPTPKFSVVRAGFISASRNQATFI